MPIYRILLTTFALLITVPLQAQTEGARIYEQQCAACHGANGDGGVGVPLALPDFQYSVTNDYLIKTIRLGRPGRVMPAFTRLSDKEVNSLVKHIRTWAPGKPFKYTRESVKGDIKHGKQLYAKHCAACHGANGKGGKGTGVTFSRPRDLPVIAPALNNSGFLASAPDTMIKATLMNGREGTPMMSFLKQGLSESDINDVVAYVRSFEKQPRAKKDYGSHGPVITIESSLSLDDTVANIKKAIVGKNYRIIRVQPLNQGLVAKGKETTKQIIIYFCNFSLLNRALAIDPRVGLFLPCRITAYEKDGTVFVNSSNPLYMSKFFNNDELNKLCEEMSQDYADIIEEATL